MPGDEPQWLRIARELGALAQTGLAFTADRFEREMQKNAETMIRALVTEA